MELEGVVRNGVIIPDLESSLPDGTRVKISVSPCADQETLGQKALAQKALAQKALAKKTLAKKTFGKRFAKFKGAVPDLPADLAKQHDHYRLGTPKK
jgi:hypothetical protein